jgi:hypothetical protein
MLVIMDSIQWKGSLGSQLRQIFREEVQGLPREEPMFNLAYIYPRRNPGLIAQIRNLVIVFTLDQDTPGSRILKEQFSENAIGRIQSDTSFHIYTTDDEYSRGQEVMYLFAMKEAGLIDYLKKNKDRIQSYFNDLERQRLTEDIVGTSSTKPLTEFLKKDQGCEIRVPFGYKLADKQEDLVWLRQMGAEIDKNVFISWKDYNSEYQLRPDSLIAWRDDIASRFLFEDPERPNTYLVTETSVPYKPVVARQMNFDGEFAMELKGLWKTNNNTMGGPFVSYSLVDNSRGRLYYIEGFCFSPGKNQRETIRELEAILHTFKPVATK